MNAIGRTVTDLHRGEQQLAGQLLAVAAGHRAEHEVFHVARDLERWSAEHARRLADIAGRFGATAQDEAPDPAHRRDATRDRSTDEPSPPGLRLLHDLCDLYLMASQNSLNWEMLGQAAQATRDSDLLELVSRCHPQTLRQVRWANTMIKTLSPQILSST